MRRSQMTSALVLFSCLLTVEGWGQENTQTKAAPAPGAPFVKGELSSFIGSSKLVTKNNRVGIRLGWQDLDQVHYLTINPELDLRFGELTFGLGVPLALQIFDGNLSDDDLTAGFDNAGHFRTEDWDEWGEYARFIRYLTWGRKEGNIYFSLSQVGSNSLGHGALVRRYSVNIDPDSTRVAGQLDMYNDYAGFELMVNSLVEWDLFGALAFVKPLSFLFDHPIARSLSVGFTYFLDRHAPVRLATRPAEQANPANPYYLLGDARPKVTSHAWLHAMGVDVEVKVLKTDSVDIKPFVDYSWMMPATPTGQNPPKPTGGGGLTLGVLGRLNFGTQPVHALRMIAEFRSFSANYLPGYFDTFYEVHKYSFNQHYEHYARTQQTLPPTKFVELFVNRSGDRHLGFYLEFNYSVVGELSFSLALEGSDARFGNHFLAHLEVPALGWLQFFASYHQRAMESLGDLFSTAGSDKVVFAAARLQLARLLFLNLRYHYTLQFHEGERDLDGDDLLDPFRLYEPRHGFMGDIELGWEF